MQDIFGPDDTVEEKVTAPITQIGMTTISTNLFDITFKSHEVGDIVVDGNRNYLANNIINGLLNQLCINIGELTYKIQALIEGDEAVGRKTARKPSENFDGHVLKPEIAAQLTLEQQVEATKMFAEQVTYFAELQALVAERSKMPAAKRGKLQFGYIGAALVNVIGGKPRPMNTWQEAIDVRTCTYGKRLTAEKLYKDEEQGFSAIEAMNKANII